MTSHPASGRPAPSAATTLSGADYDRLTRLVLASLETAADQWLQQDIIDIDTSRTGGLLQMSFPDGSQLIVNTQPPLQEIWLAARGGGFHFRHLDGRWVDTRDGSDFFEVLSHHATLQGGKALRFVPPAVQAQDS